jgi:hypothetical protein
MRPIWRAAEIRIDKKLNIVNNGIEQLLVMIEQTNNNIDMLPDKISCVTSTHNNFHKQISSCEKSHIIISGVGRSGTTLLVQYFSALGLDTGFTEEESMSDVDPISHAGLEFADICNEDIPYIIKSPLLCDTLEQSLNDKCATIDAAIIPMRNLYAATASRARASKEASKLGIDPVEQPGGLWKCSTVDNQSQILAEQFYKIIYVLVNNDIPIYFIDFPRFAEDHCYLYKILKPILHQQGITHAESMAAHGRVVNRSLINKF